MWPCHEAVPTPGHLGRCSFAMKPFQDQVALIAGAGGDIGRAIALALARGGATLFLVGRRRPAPEAAADRARRAPASRLIYPADLTVEAEVHALLEHLELEARQLDILVHSAGIIEWGEHDTAPIADLDAQYRANLRAPYLLTQA